MVFKRVVALFNAVGKGSLCKFVVFLVFTCVNFPACIYAVGISPEKCLIWGPGLTLETVLPVRYFYIQAVNAKGENLTVSPGKLHMSLMYKHIKSRG